MAETLTGETDTHNAKTDQEVEVNNNLEVANPGEDDSKRWTGDNEALPVELEIVPVGVGVRGLGRFNRYRHRVESAALPTGHMALRGAMPEFIK